MEREGRSVGWDRQSIRASDPPQASQKLRGSATKPYPEQRK